MGPRTAPVKAEDIAAHFKEIGRTDQFSIPESLTDEFVHLVGRIKKGE
jgi:hypothetical protein